MESLAELVNSNDTVDDDENQRCYLDIVSYNMHGFNQGISTVRDMTMLFKCPIFLLQEHWLTPFNLYRFNDNLPDYLCFGSSAMGSCIESGVVRGRPYGGVMTLVHKSLQKCTQIVCSDERFVIVIVGDVLIVNVYLPCSGSENRLFTYQEVLDNITLWIDQYPDKDVIFGGDLNLNLENRDVFCDMINQFVSNNRLIRCDHLFFGAYYSTYYNDSLNRYSTIDYLFTRNCEMVRNYNVIDPVLNLSDHRPVVIRYNCVVAKDSCCSNSNANSDINKSKTSFLRWDRANLAYYRELTRVQLTPVWHDLCSVDVLSDADVIDVFL